MNNIYTHFAKSYDRYFAHIDIHEWARYLLKISNIIDIKDKNVLDLGCGTGSMLIEFAKLGALLTGIDFSDEMLSEADNKINFLKLKNISLRKGDISRYYDNKKYDLIYCICDTLNYLNETSLASHFKNVSLLLKRDGIYTFDIINNEFDIKTDEKYYLSDSTEIEIHREIKEEILNTVIILKNNNNKFIEEHKQYLYPMDLYIKLAELNNMKLKDVFEFLSEDSPDKKSDKIQIVVVNN